MTDFLNATELESGCDHHLNGTHDGHGGVSLVHWNWNYVQLPMIIAIFVLLSALVKIGKSTLLMVRFTGKFY